MSLAIHPLDVCIIAAYLVGIVLFGMWIGRGQTNVNDYLLGDRNLPWWLVLLSIVSTETSTVTFLSVPGLAFKSNMAFLQLTAGYIVGRFLVVWLLLPQYFRGELFTAYDVLHRQFGGATKRVASLLFMVTRSFADGLRLFLTAIALKVLFSTSETSSAFDPQLTLAIIVMGVAMIVYTVVGGLKAVVWTDAIQFLIYIVGALIAGWVLVSKLPNGMTGLLAYGNLHHKFAILDLSLNPTKTYTLAAGVCGGAFVSLGSHGVDQLMVQRYLAARSQREAGWALALSGPIVMAQFALFLCLGVGLASFYQGQEFGKNDAVFATFIARELPTGLVGLALAGVFAAALSSSLNSLAGAFVNDFYMLARPQAGPRQYFRMTKIMTVVFGLIQIAVGIAAQGFVTSVVDNVLAIASFTTGIILGVFFLGRFAPQIGQKSALIALVCGLTMMVCIKFVLPLAGKEYELAWPWFAVVGSLGTFAIGVLADTILSRSSRDGAKA